MVRYGGTAKPVCRMQSGICLHCAFALRDAKSVRETKAEPGSQGARRDVLENTHKYGMGQNNRGNTKVKS